MFNIHLCVSHADVDKLTKFLKSLSSIRLDSQRCKPLGPGCPSHMVRNLACTQMRGLYTPRVISYGLHMDWVDSNPQSMDSI